MWGGGASSNQLKILKKKTFSEEEEILQAGFLQTEAAMLAPPWIPAHWPTL